MIETNELNLGEREFQQISDLIYRHCGINLHEGKRELVRARLARYFRLSGLSSTQEMLAQMEKDRSGELLKELVDILSTNLTSFFRESGHFDYLTQSFLPALMERKRRRGDQRIRGWSAGCSSGEEPYTLAITLTETLDGQGPWDAKLLATDISRRVLRVAMAGNYEPKRLEGVDAGRRNRFFRPITVEGSRQFQVNEELRNMIRFRHLNLMEGWPFSGPFDFIFCRNVMIYFDKPTQENLVNRFWEHLDSGGLLLTGHSESLTGIKHRFQYVRPTIYAKA